MLTKTTHKQNLQEEKMSSENSFFFYITCVFSMQTFQLNRTKLENGGSNSQMDNEKENKDL